MNNIISNKSLIVVTWDGISEPLNYIHFDGQREFYILLYDYSGSIKNKQNNNLYYDYFLSTKSECKGDILNNISLFLKENNFDNKFNYIGLFDDDILVSIKDLNKALFLAKVEQLDVFQLSLTHDSYYNHRQFINKSGFNIILTPWVEIMAPFYKLDIFIKASQYFKYSISGTGIDVYLIPTIQNLLNKNKTAVIHSVQMKHCRPIRTDGRIFSNGLDNLQEIKNMRKISYDIYYSNIQKFDTNFSKQILNKVYIHGIPLKYKFQRIPLMIRNIYKYIVNESYR